MMSHEDVYFGKRAKISPPRRACSACSLPRAQPVAALALSYHGHQDGGLRVLGHPYLPRARCALHPQGWAGERGHAKELIIHLTRALQFFGMVLGVCHKGSNDKESQGCLLVEVVAVICMHNNAWVKHAVVVVEH